MLRGHYGRLSDSNISIQFWNICRDFYQIDSLFCSFYRESFCRPISAFESALSWHFSYARAFILPESILIHFIWFAFIERFTSLLITLTELLQDWRIVHNILQWKMSSVFRMQWNWQEEELMILNALTIAP